MEYRLDSMMGFDKLGLYFEVHTAGLDGENFSYSIYFEGNPTEEDFTNTKHAIGEFTKPYDDKDIYLGYMDISKLDDKLSIYLDLGNVQPQYESVAIEGILKTLNNVKGIQSVIVNEDCDFDF